MELKKQIAKIVSKISVKSALSSTDSASRKGYSQPKYVTTDISRDYADYNLVYHHWGSRYNASSAGGANSYSLAVTLHYVVRQY